MTFFKSAEKVFLILTVFLFFAGCEALKNEGGSFSVKFNWPENGKPDFSEGYYVWIEMQEWVDGDVENTKIHLKEGPVVFSADGKASFKLDGLSYGKNRVILVEVRKSESALDRTLYYGISKLFDFEPQKDTAVSVEMNMTATPGTEGGKSNFTISVVKDGVPVDKVAQKSVSIRINKAVGEKVVFSNRLELLDVQANDLERDYTGSEVIDFSTLIEQEDGSFQYDNWDLLEGRAENDQADGMKVIYAKIIDSQGYRSEMAYTSVGLDTKAPEVINVAVSPAGSPGMANIGTDVIVRFMLSEPVTEFSFDGNSLEFTDNSSGDNRIFVYKVTDADEDGATYEFKVSAKDEAGNELKGHSLGSVKIDSTLPEVVSFSVSKEKVKTKEEFSVSLEVSEALKSLNVLIGAKSISDKCNLEEESLTKYICRHKADIDGDEGDGVKQIAVQLTDPADNGISETLKFEGKPVTIEYDITEPILASSVILPETVNKSSETVNLKFSFAEKVSLKLSDIVLDPVSDLVFDCGDISGYSKSFKCSASFDNEDERVASYSVSVSVSDEVGNLSSNVDLGMISVDRKSPFLSSQNVDPEAVKLEEEFTVSFSVSEELLADPVVRVGDKTLPGSECVLNSLTSLWTCTHKANKDGDEPDGQKMISVYIVDKAGNASTEILKKSIVYDATAPVLINKVFIPGTKLNSYDGLFQVRFSFSEKVRNDSSFIFSYVTDEGDTFSKPVSCTSTDGMNQSFYCEFNLLPEDSIQGKYTFFIDATDLSGNRLVQDGAENKIGTIEIDRKLPEITVESIDPENVNYESDYIEVFFTVNKPVAEFVNPEVKLGTNIQTVTPYDVNSERTEFTYRVSDLHMAYDGTQIITVKAEDLFGNKGDASRGGIHIDRTKPTIITSDLNRVVAKEGEEIVVSVTFSEEMNPASVIIEDGGLGLLKNTHISTDRIFVYSYSVVPEDAGAREKSYSISISGRDTFDNALVPSYQIGAVTLDLTPPTNSEITDLEIITLTSDFYTVDSLAVASTFQPEIDYSFNVTNVSEIFERPEVFIGYNSAPVTDCNGDENTINCYGTYFVSGDEGEGVKHLTVNLYDAVGNRVTHTPGAVIFDFTGPRLVSTSVTRNPAFSPSRDSANKTQHFSRKDPFSEADVELVLTMYADELIDTGFSNTIDNLPCETGSYAVDPGEISSYSLTHRRNVNDCVGLYSPVVNWSDLVGNEVARESDWKISVVDNEPSPLDIRREYITYYRKPFGSIGSTATPEFYINSSPETVISDDIAMVAFYTETGILAGSAVVEDDGSFSVDTLTGGDVPVIYVNPVSFTGTKIPVKDDLGNPYDIKTVLQSVPNVVWTANLNRKVVGNSWPNPTKFMNISRGINYLERDLASNSEEIALLPSSVTAGISASKRNGDEIQTFEDPEGIGSFYREGRASAYNSISDKLLVFGGRTVPDGSSSQIWYNDLAEWDGDSWKIIDVEGLSPDSAALSAMVYFETGDYYILFGGSRLIESSFDHYYFSDTWLWNENHWVKSDETGPSARAKAAFAYDPLRKTAVLFGGENLTGDINPVDGLRYANDGTWEWNGSEWVSVTLLDPEGDGNPEPSMGSMVYDYSEKKMVYHDGISGKTWKYDGQSWELITASGPILKHFDMIYDSVANRILLTGGIKPDYSISDGFYTFNGVSWTQLSDMPYEIRKHVMWYSKTKNKSYVSFGSYNLGYLDAFLSLLEWDGTSWKEQSFETHNLDFPALAYYPTRNKVYQFGGKQDGFTDRFTFEFDGMKWNSIDNGATRPTVVDNHDMIYYPPEDVLLLFDYITSKMWQFDGTNWSIRLGASGPSKVKNYKMEYFPDQSNVVFIAGTDEGVQTWTYNGSAWTSRCLDGVPSGCVQPEFYSYNGLALSYNASTHRVYGISPEEHGEAIRTWRWTGTVWQALTITDPEGDGGPQFIYTPAAMYSSSLQKTILVGTSDFDLFEIWSFNGTSYKKIQQENISKRYYFDAVWMDNVDSILIRGGRSGRSEYDYPVKNYYIVKLPEWTVPTQQYTVPLSMSGMPDEAGVQKIDISWIGGGTTSDAGGAYEGAVLSFWNKNGWEDLIYGKGSATSNGLIFEEISDPDALENMQSGYKKDISFKITPKITGSFSDVIPSVSTSAVEATVYYNVDGKKTISPYLDSDYKVSSKYLSWEAARQDCLKWGGDLLIINSSDEEDIVRSLPEFNEKAEYWIGVNDIFKDLEYRTVSGRLIYSNGIIDDNYVKWGKYNPYASTTDNCATLADGKWFLTDCTKEKNFICEKSRENKFVVSTKKANWTNAQTECVALDMDLVIVNGPYEQSQIENLTGGAADFWLGYTDRDLEGTWRWVNGLVGWIGTSAGSSYFYNNWQSGYPSTASANYDYAFISMSGNKKWRNNVSGATLKYFICEENSEELFCSLNDQDCSENETCCSNLCSEDFECVACLKNGDKSCTTAGNCCGGICNTSSKECVKCLDLNERTCTNITDCCDSSAICASGKCCYSLGTTCTSNVECCTGMSCGSEDECCKSFGTSCKLNKECCSNTCYKGSCVK